MSGISASTSIRALESRGHPEYGADSDASLEKEDIRPTAFIPVHAGEEWRGFFGYDDFVEPRRWSSADIQAPKAVAAILGGATYREHLDPEVRAKDVMGRSHLLVLESGGRKWQRTRTTR